MSAKILPAIVVGLLLGTTALASAQQNPYGYGPPGMMMYPDAYWQSPYVGTPFQNVAPYTSNQEPTLMREAFGTTSLPIPVDSL